MVPAVPILGQAQNVHDALAAALTTVVALAAALISFGDASPNPSAHPYGPGLFSSLPDTSLAPPAIYPSLPSFSADSHGKHGDMVFSSHTQQGTRFGRGLPSFPAGQFPLRQVPIGRVNENGQPAGLMLVYNPFTTSDLYNWKQNNPAYRDDPKPKTDLSECVFTTHHPIWAAVYSLLNIPLTAVNIPLT